MDEGEQVATVYEDLEVRVRFQRFLELFLEIDLARMEELLRESGLQKGLDNDGQS